MTTTPDDQPDPGPFPPATLEAFLRCCAGDWMSLRSRFTLGDRGEGDDWHSSERGELVVSYVDGTDGGPGGLQVTPKRDGSQQQPSLLLFGADGGFSTSSGAEGTWSLWPDGSLELVLDSPGGTVREKIWFTKPNLRLRSTVESRADGAPGRASFSSEIRRVSRPA
ncbi:MAG: phycobiliprotein lyase [Cyanobacteria bacterium REEB417]|nr:phycobiliprotein lyase [Cyanobacteria bacterium REEB417]